MRDSRDRRRPPWISMLTSTSPAESRRSSKRTSTRTSDPGRSTSSPSTRPLRDSARSRGVVVALAVLSTRSRGRIDGVHVHTSYGFDLVRVDPLLETARRRKFPTIVMSTARAS